ncbi:DUF488 domain-containing protein [Aequorivita sp. SDUM287046]|uniref:DUF488 domain-containing protein n=1 Tax=Aequorivita aurantiaca TaxID=3053356 RepID=A0ABT8DKX3_9FLAO|nr:DUF488 domain-containing protein [Aequorivita aurantiaca]MDN3723697.1 DUF488 domain-containing protein [Aequorivita aurantiaca]
MKTIWTIGHSTREWEKFLALLHSFETLQDSLPKEGVQYIHMVDLGGRRKALPHSENDAWRNESFKGYADYMATQQFKNALEILEEVASKNPTAIMCSEAVWWRCHRSLIADILKLKGWIVQHIMAKNNSSEHPYTSPAKVVNGSLDYSAEKDE